MKVAILCGGLGTRLRGLTGDQPKAMVDVGGRPFLEYVIDSFLLKGFDDFVLLTGYKADAIESYFGDGKLFGAHIEYSRENEPLGTGGAIRDARRLLGDRFLLTYGDVLRRFDYDRFVTEHQEPCVAVYVAAAFRPSRDGLKPVPTLRGNTAIADGRVTRFDKNADLPYIDAGFCVMPSSVIDLLPAKGSFEETVFPRLARERRLACEIVDQNFYDIGTPEELARTRAALA